MPITGSNQWGPYSSAATGDDLPEYAPAAVSQPPGDIVVPQSPSGSVTGQSATWNYANGLTTTENVLQNVLMVDSGPEGSNALTAPVEVKSLNPVQIAQNAYDAATTAPVVE